MPNVSNTDELICTLQYKLEQLSQEIKHVSQENLSLHARIDELEDNESNCDTFNSEYGYGGTF